MATNHKRLVNRDKERNRFLRLRYQEGATLADMPDISANQLAQELGISKAVISKLESETLEDCHGDKAGDIPPCKASTLKLYHDRFGCSYEYLMGETECKTPEYYSMGKDPILSLFDDSFFNSLKELLGNMEYQRFNLYMLQAFMSNPQYLQYFMETVFYHLYSINKIHTDSSIRKAEKDTQTAQLWFSLHTRMKEYFETCLMAKLDYGFRQHEQRLAEQRLQEKRRLQEEQRLQEERQKQWEKQAAKDSQLFEVFLKDNPDFDVSKYLNTTFTPLEDSNNDN